MLITSLQNPRVKELVKLKSRRHRDEAQQVLIEGYKALKMALDNDVTILEVFYCPSLYLGSNEPALVTLAKDRGATLYETNEAVFRKIAYRDRPEGLIAVAKPFHKTIDELTVGEHSLYLVAEAIEKPGNLGTMLRSADACGVDGVIVCDGITDIYNPNVVRASIGTIFSQPVVLTTSEEFFAWKTKHDVLLAATTPSANKMHTDVDMTGRVALAVGTEQVGLPDDWLDRADIQVLIPMYGQADSLNAATSASLVLYEAVRQRRAADLLA